VCAVLEISHCQLLQFVATLVHSLTILRPTFYSVTKVLKIKLCLLALIWTVNGKYIHDFRSFVYCIVMVEEVVSGNQSWQHCKLQPTQSKLTSALNRTPWAWPPVITSVHSLNTRHHVQFIYAWIFQRQLYHYWHSHLRTRGFCWSKVLLHGLCTEPFLHQPGSLCCKYSQVGPVVLSHVHSICGTVQTVSHLVTTIYRIWHISVTS